MLRCSWPKRRAISEHTAISGGPTSKPVTLSEIAMPNTVVTTVKTNPAMPRGRQTTAYSNSAHLRRAKGARRNVRMTSFSSSAGNHTSRRLSAYVAAPRSTTVQIHITPKPCHGDSRLPAS